MCAEYMDYAFAAGMSFSERIFCCHPMANWPKDEISLLHLCILLSTMQENSRHRKWDHFNF